MSTPGGHRGRPPRRLPLFAWAALWVLVAGAVVLPLMRAYTVLSPIDEFHHVDYLAKTQDLEHVNGGELAGQTAMREQACRGLDQVRVLPPCGSEEFDPADFPGEGFNHTYSDPPTYYVVTAAVASVLDQVPGVTGIVTAGRAAGVLWLGAGLMVTFLLSLRLGASPLAGTGVTLLVASTPTVVQASATITTDAPALLVGGALCLAALGVVDGRVRWRWLLLAGAAAMAVKVTSIAVVSLVVVFLLLDLMSKRRPGGGRAVRTGLARIAAFALVAVVPSVAWTVFSAATALPTVDDIPVAQMFKVDSLTWTQLADGVAGTITPVTKPIGVSILQVDSLLYFVGALNVLLIAAVAGLAWFMPGRTQASRFATATLTTLLLVGPGFVLLIFFAAHASFYIPSRYVLSLLPAAAACLAVAASRRRGGEVGVLVLGLLGMTALLATTL